LSALFGSAFNTPSGGGTPYGTKFTNWLLSQLPSGAQNANTNTGGGTIDANGNPVYGGGAVVNDPLGGDYGGVYPDTSSTDASQSWEDYYNNLSGSNNDAYYSDTPVEP